MVTFLNPDGPSPFFQMLPSMSTHSMIPAPTPYDYFSNFIALAIHFSTGAMGIHRQSGASSSSSSSLRCSLGVSRLMGSSPSSILPLKFHIIFSGSSSCTCFSATSSRCCAKELVPGNCYPNRAIFCVCYKSSGLSIQCCLPLSPG